MADHVYILASREHGTLYVGMTGNLQRRIYEHRKGLLGGFTRRYKVHRPIRLETFDEPMQAIQREKSLKEWPRDWKTNLIERNNPDWADQYDALNR